MKKTIQIIILFFTFINQTNSQDIKLGFQSGIGTYSMSGLKGLNNTITQSLPFDSKIVSDFPQFWYYRPMAFMKLNNNWIGLVCTFQSTGSRISAKDYSGEYRCDMKVNTLSPGIYGDINLWSQFNFRASLYAIIGISFSNLAINNYFNVLDTVLTNETVNCKAMNYYCEPGLNLTYSIKSVSIGVNIDYLLQFGDQAFYTGGNTNNKLYNPQTQSAVKPEWNGIRAGVSIYFSIDKNTLNSTKPESSSKISIISGQK